MDRIVFCGGIAALLASCATSHYGRELPVIPLEATTYDCPAIALEIAKCDAFTKGIYAQWSDSKGRRFWGFMMDFGIGDHRERNDALESAERRRGELVTLGAAKNCPTPPPAPTDD